jgi:hypothetical protein
MVKRKPKIVGECLYCGRALVRYENPEAVENWRRKISAQVNGYFLSTDGFFFWIHRGYVEVWLQIEIPQEVRGIRQKCPYCIFHNL